jgi:hypothetical protein
VSHTPTNQQSAKSLKTKQPTKSYLPWRHRHKIPRILLNRLNARNKIHLLRLKELRVVKDLPPKIQNGTNTNHRIGKEERRDGPVARQEDSVSADKSHDCRAAEGYPCNIRLEPAAVGEGVTRDALCVEGFFEADVGECYYGEVD